MKLNINSSNELGVVLTDKNDDPVLSATVICTIVDLKGDAVPGVTWPLVLSSVGSGSYSTVLPSSLNLTRYQRLKAQITASKSGFEAYAEVPILVDVDND